MFNTSYYLSCSHLTILILSAFWDFQSKQDVAGISLLKTRHHVEQKDERINK